MEEITWDPVEVSSSDGSRPSSRQSVIHIEDDKPNQGYTTSCQGNTTTPAVTSVKPALSNVSLDLIRSDTYHCPHCSKRYYGFPNLNRHLNLEHHVSSLPESFKEILLAKTNKICKRERLKLKEQIRKFIKPLAREEDVSGGFTSLREILTAPSSVSKPSVSPPEKTDVSGGFTSLRDILNSTSITPSSASQSSVSPPEEDESSTIKPLGSGQVEREIVIVLSESSDDEELVVDDDPPSVSAATNSAATNSAATNSAASYSDTTVTTATNSAATNSAASYSDTTVTTATNSAATISAASDNSATDSAASDNDITENEAFQCPLCTTQFPLFRALNVHLRTWHNHEELPAYYMNIVKVKTNCVDSQNRPEKSPEAPEVITKNSQEAAKTTTKKSQESPAVIDQTFSPTEVEFAHNPRTLSEYVYKCPTCGCLIQQWVHMHYHLTVAHTNMAESMVTAIKNRPVNIKLLNATVPTQLPHGRHKSNLKVNWGFKCLLCRTITRSLKHLHGHFDFVHQGIALDNNTYQVLFLGYSNKSSGYELLGWMRKLDADNLCASDWRYLVPVASLLKHREQHVNLQMLSLVAGEQRFRCPICPLTFADMRRVRHHVDSDHLNDFVSSAHLANINVLCGAKFSSGDTSSAAVVGGEKKIKNVKSLASRKNAITSINVTNTVTASSPSQSFAVTSSTPRQSINVTSLIPLQSIAPTSPTPHRCTDLPPSTPRQSIDVTSSTSHQYYDMTSASLRAILSENRTHNLGDNRAANMSRMGKEAPRVCSMGNDAPLVSSTGPRTELRISHNIVQHVDPSPAGSANPGLSQYPTSAQLMSLTSYVKDFQHASVFSDTTSESHPRSPGPQALTSHPSFSGESGPSFSELRPSSHAAFTWPCPQCCKRFGNRHDLVLHVEIAHSVLDAETARVGSPRASNIHRSDYLGTVDLSPESPTSDNMATIPAEDRPVWKLVRAESSTNKVVQTESSMFALGLKCILCGAGCTGLKEINRHLMTCHRRHPRNLLECLKKKFAVVDQRPAASRPSGPARTANHIASHTTGVSSIPGIGKHTTHPPNVIHIVPEDDGYAAPGRCESFTDPLDSFLTQTYEENAVAPAAATCTNVNPTVIYNIAPIEHQEMEKQGELPVSSPERLVIPRAPVTDTEIIDITMDSPKSPVSRDGGHVIQEAARGGGHVIQEAARESGHEIREVTRDGGHVIQEAARDGGHVIREATESLRQAEEQLKQHELSLIQHTTSLKEHRMSVLETGTSISKAKSALRHIESSLNPGRDELQTDNLSLGRSRMTLSQEDAPVSSRPKTTSSHRRTFQCGVCDAAFVSYAAMINHYDDQHGAQVAGQNVWRGAGSSAAEIKIPQSPTLTKLKSEDAETCREPIVKAESDFQENESKCGIPEVSAPSSPLSITSDDQFPQPVLKQGVRVVLERLNIEEVCWKYEITVRGFPAVKRLATDAAGELDEIPPQKRRKLEHGAELFTCICCELDYCSINSLRRHVRLKHPRGDVIIVGDKKAVPTTGISETPGYEEMAEERGEEKEVEMDDEREEEMDDERAEERDEVREEEMYDERAEERDEVREEEMDDEREEEREEEMEEESEIEDEGAGSCHAEPDRSSSDKTTDAERGPVFCCPDCGRRCPQLADLKAHIIRALTTEGGCSDED